MSENEGTRSKDDEDTQINQDEGCKNPKIITEDKVSLDPNKNTETGSAEPENMPRKRPDDDKVRDLRDNLESVKTEAVLTEMSEEFINTDEDTGAGDFMDKTKVSGRDDDDVTADKDKSNDSFLNKCAKIESEADDLDEIENMELRWDDDDDEEDGSNQANDKNTRYNDDLRSEDQLLKELSDIMNKDTTVTPSNVDSNATDSSLESAVSKVHSEENSLTSDNNSKEIETTKESEISPKLVIPKDNILADNDHYLNTEPINSPEESLERDDINNVEDVLSKKSEVSPKLVIPKDKNILADKYHYLNTEPITSPEENLDRDDINDLEVELSKESEIVTEPAVIARAKDILEEKSMNEPTQEWKEDTSDDQAKEDPAHIMEDHLLVESLSNTETRSITLKLESVTDVILNEDNDLSMSEENLLKEPDCTGISSFIISEKDTEPSIKVHEKETPMSEEDNDDDELEERLLLEPEIAEVIPESDIRMDIDYDEEGVLLQEDEGQEDSYTPMDVSIGDQAKVDDMTIEQTMNQSEVVTKDIALPIDDQTIIEKVHKTAEEIKGIDQPHDQSKIMEKVIDQPIKDTTNTANIIKDTPIEAEAKINEKIASEEETIEKEQLILESNAKEQSIEGPVETDALTVSSTPEILVEDVIQSIPEKNTLIKEIKNEADPEELTEDTGDMNKDTDSDKPEKSKGIISPDTTLDKNKEVDEISPNHSILLEDSCPIKTDHGVDKPDVMLEIPTQELIDMDDTDLSMNLDHSAMIDSLNDTDKNVDVDKLIQEKTIDTNIIHDIVVSVNVATDDTTVSEKSIQLSKADKDTVKEKPVDQKAIDTEMTTADKIIAEDDVEKQKSGDQLGKVIESTVSEVRTESSIVESEKLVDTVVPATVEESMERLFADIEPAVAKEVSECNASRSQAQVPMENLIISMPQMTPDTTDEVPEIDDSLGLLAETAGRMMEDDDEPDDDFDDDDDDEFDQDESSNQISPEQSEDSNPAALESEPVTDQENNDSETPDTKDNNLEIMISGSASLVDKTAVEEEYGTIELNAETIKDMNEEVHSAVDGLLNADNPVEEPVQDQQESTDQMDIDTVRLSDTSDNDIEVEPTEVQQPQQPVAESDKEKQKSPNRTHTFAKQLPSQISQSPFKSQISDSATAPHSARTVVNIVDLEESSSSEDDLQEVQKEPETIENVDSPLPETGVTNVNIPTGIDIMSSGGSTSEITTKDNRSQVVISCVPKPPPHKPARLNTSEVSIKTVSNTEPLVIPETMMNEQNQTSVKRMSLEIFSLDSDEDEIAAKEKTPPTSPDTTIEVKQENLRVPSKCINYCCKSDNEVSYIPAKPYVVEYYDPDKKRRPVVCQPCADLACARAEGLIQGLKYLTPLLELDVDKLSQDLVEISDSESEDEDMSPEEPKESIAETEAKFAEDNLAKYLNDIWEKHDMDVRFKETEIMIDDEIEKIHQDRKDLTALINQCQVATDKLRCELYASFEIRRQKLPPVAIIDTPESQYIGLENLLNQQSHSTSADLLETRKGKRRASTAIEIPAKRPAIPLGYAPLDGGDSNKEKAAIPGSDNKPDEDKDISVVKLSAETAPADLPPPGEISHPPLRVGMPVYAMKNAFGPWLKSRVAEMQPKNASGGNPFTMCLIKFDHKVRASGKILPARCIAYPEPADVRMTIGTRLIALFKAANRRESYYSGVVAETPSPVNNYRYLVFFDDGYAQYVQHQFTRLVCECSPLVWEEVHPFSRQFVHDYLTNYPERAMVRVHEGQHLKTEWNGKWWSSRVTRVDASLAQVMFVGDGRREWIYRGSTRLAPLYNELRAAERHRPRPMPRSKAQPRSNMPYVEYTRSDEQEKSNQVDAQVQQQEQEQQNETQTEEVRIQRAVAKKSTTALPQATPPSQQIISRIPETFPSRVVYYTPKNAVRPLKFREPHRCTPRCKRSDVLSLKELRTYNPLAKPLLSGWEREIVRFKGVKEVMYRAPCGRRIRNMRELHYYLRTVDSDLPVDLFDFHYMTHCLAEFVLNKSLTGKRDLSHGKENVPVPCVNSYDKSLPDFCSYNTERTPTAGVPLNLEPEFLCGCDCTDDCQDKSKCACWKMTLEGARTIGLRGPNVGYSYKRLPEPLPSGIYECNSRCKCKHTCLNRVAQHPLQLKLQVFKTPNRGWGIRALNDVPKGSFLCVYAGNLLTDATANLDGLTEGDEYLAELDYIEVVEQMKEGYEEDIPEADKRLDKKGSNDEEDSADTSSTEEEETANKTDKEDDDFRPGYIGLDVAQFNKRLRKREEKKKNKKVKEEEEKERETDSTKEKDPNAEEDCITISDDEEVREPSRFMAQTNMVATEYVSKYKSVRTLFGEDEACYIMDAKVQGNIGRYLNHSCCPNVFVQNVFVDTHDPRFPWVAFFALSHIKAGTELTWNYNYDVGSVPGKILYCYCGAENCRGRLL